MIRYIDNIINSITMYRLVLYGLIVIAVYAVVCGFLGVLPYSGIQFIGSATLFLGVCYSTNWLFSKLFKAPTNVESWMITALILFLLFMPVASQGETLMLILAGLIAMASKYVLAINRKHIFNPAAFAAVVLSLNANTVALWWVGSPVMLPVVLAVGFLVVRKIRKFSMFFAFIAASIAGTFILAITNKSLRPEVFVQMFTSGPIIFLGTIMLIEPLTMPPRRKLQIVYGAIVGALSTMQFNIGPLYSTPELAIVIGNIFSYIVSPKYKLFLAFKERREIAHGIYEFEFESEKLKISAKIPPNLPLKKGGVLGWIPSFSKGGLGRIFGSQKNFEPGQYMEWTLAHEHPDSRGVRRFFTVASSPTETNIKIGTRIIDGSSPKLCLPHAGGFQPRAHEGRKFGASSFKKRLLSLSKGDRIIASQLAGDFVLPDDRSKKLVFIAGGIGITPFRSMAQYLIDKKEKRDIVLFYFNKTEDEIAYKDIFDRGKAVGLRTVYILTDREHVVSDWKGQVGGLDAKMLSEEAPDYKERIFYISGRNTFVNSCKHTLLTAGVGRSNIKTDYFPGL